MPRSTLTERQIDRAYRLFYGEGMTLRMVMQELDCGLYDLSPWLTAPAMRIASAAIADERKTISEARQAPSHRRYEDHAWRLRGILAVLAQFPGEAISEEIGKAMGYRGGAAVEGPRQRLNELVAMGMATKDTRPTRNTRRSYYAITPAGRAALASPAQSKGSESDG